MQVLKFSKDNYKINLRIHEKLPKSDLEYINNLLYENLFQYSKVTNRYNPDSELFQFNNIITNFRGSREFFNYLSDAIHWFGITDGVFNPFVTSILDNLKALPKSAQWKDEQLFKMENINLDFPKTVGDLPRFIEIDYTNYHVKFLNPVNLDLNGLSKGKFLDKLAGILRKYINHFSLTFGGDKIYVTPDRQEDWQVKVDNPVTGEKGIITINARNEGISISGKIGLKDVLEDATKYTLLDAEKQEKIKTELAMVVIRAENAITSDVLAKTFYLADEKERKMLANKFQNIKRVEIDKKGKVIMH